MVGVIKGILTTAIGFFTFGGLPATVLTVGGMVLNAVGGALYTYAKYIEKRRELQTVTSTLLSTPSKENLNTETFIPQSIAVALTHRHDCSVQLDGNNDVSVPDIK